MTTFAGPEEAAAPVLPANLAGGPRLGGPTDSNSSSSAAAAFLATGFFAGGRGLAGTTSSNTASYSSSISTSALLAEAFFGAALGAAFAAAAAFFLAAASAAAAFFSDLSYLLSFTVSFAALIFVFFASMRGSTYFYVVAGQRAERTPRTMSPWSLKPASFSSDTPTIKGPMLSTIASKSSTYVVRMARSMN